MHTFVINLDRDIERMDAIHGHLVQCGLGDDYERISASNDRDDGMPGWTEHMCPQNVNGCFASHRKCWREIVNRNLEWALILEDDVRFSDDAPKVLEGALRDLPGDCDVLYLGCNGECTSQVTSHVGIFQSLLGFRSDCDKKVESDYIDVPLAPYTTHAYIITYKGAKKLLESEQALGICHVDAFMVNFRELQAYACKPVIAFQQRDRFKSGNLLEFPRIPTQIMNYLGYETYDLNIKQFQIFGTVTITIFVVILGILIRFFPWLLVFLIPDIVEGDLNMVISVLFISLMTSAVL